MQQKESRIYVRPDVLLTPNMIEKRQCQVAYEKTATARKHPDGFSDVCILRPEIHPSCFGAEGRLRNWNGRENNI